MTNCLLHNSPGCHGPLLWGTQRSEMLSRKRPDVPIRPPRPLSQTLLLQQRLWAWILLPLWDTASFVALAWASESHNISGLTCFVVAHPTPLCTLGIRTPTGMGDLPEVTEPRRDGLGPHCPWCPWSANAHQGSCWQRVPCIRRGAEPVWGGAALTREVRCPFHIGRFKGVAPPPPT